MRILITAGPTREYIDAVRFITNASSGMTGYALAKAALAAGHDVTLLTGPVSLEPPTGCRIVSFVSVDDLEKAIDEHFPACDALIMAAAVGDFTVEKMPGKLSRSSGPITLKLKPTPDLLAGCAAKRRPGQVLVAFAVEGGNREEAQARAAAKLAAKGADFIVVNPPEAMAGRESLACVIVAVGRIVLPWANRPKETLAAEIIRLIS
jgi:phosphopantothenoylcysteine decarboxylase / phosphopantothenate---cysteine ligase